MTTTELSTSEAVGEMDRDALLLRYQKVRTATERLCDPLVVEDYVVQSMPDVRHAKWHLAHTSWFFETFILSKPSDGYRLFDETYEYLFNSYYNAIPPQELDWVVGKLLEKLDELGIVDNTIVVFSCDNGTEGLTRPGGCNAPFHGEKGGPVRCNATVRAVLAIFKRGIGRWAFDLGREEEVCAERIVRVKSVNGESRGEALPNNERGLRAARAASFQLAGEVVET